MITIGIVEDHDIFREGLAQSLGAASGFEVLFAVPSVDDVDPRSMLPDVSIVDLHLQDCAGPSLGSWCESGHTVLAMSAAATVAEVLGALRTGARGYLAKDSSTEETIRALRIVADGHTYVSPTVASLLLRHCDGLNADERRILDLVAQGEREADIADELDSSAESVREHLDRACVRATGGAGNADHPIDP